MERESGGLKPASGKYDEKISSRLAAGNPEAGDDSLLLEPSSTPAITN